MGVLVALADSGGNILSKYELLDRVWPNQDVADGVLTRAIHELRRVLHDSPQEPIYIETVPRRGYRLLIDPRPLVPAGKRRLSRYSVAAAAAILVLLVGGFVHLTKRTGNANPIRSVAVLPFSNLTGNPNRTYIGEALAEEVIHLIAQQHQVAVSARTSSFSFRESAYTVREIAEALGVDAVIEGSIREERGVQRVTIQLVDARNGMHTGSSTLDIQEGDLFDAQRRIGESIYSMLSAAGAQLDAAPPVSLDGANGAAYELYLRGRAELHTRSAQSLKNARQFFEEALRLDDEFAAAYAAQAQLYVVSRYYLELDAERADYLAREAAARALELDPQNVDALLVSAVLECNALRYESCLELFRRSLSLHPGNAQAHLWYGQAIQLLGYLGDAHDSIFAALRLDPLAGSTNTVAAQAAALLGHDDELLPIARKARDMGARLSVHPFILHYYRTGEVDLLIRELERYYSVIGVSTEAAAIVRQGLQGDLSHDEVLARLRPLRSLRNDYFARELVMMGMPAEALTALRESQPMGSGNFSDVWMPEFRDVRALPGFVDLVDGLGLPDIWREEGPPDTCLGPDPEIFCAQIPAISAKLAGLSIP